MKLFEARKLLQSGAEWRSVERKRESRQRKVRELGRKMGVIWWDLALLSEKMLGGKG